MPDKSYINLKKVGNNLVTPVFILSTGRAGTNWLAWAASHTLDSAVCVHEAPPGIKALGLAYYSGEVSFSEARQICLDAREPALVAVRRWLKKRFYIEVNQNMFSLMEPLTVSFPNARFAGLIRDGRDFVTSMMNKRVYQNGYDYIQPPLNYLAHDRWPNWTYIQKLAWHWQEKIRRIEEDSIKEDSIEEDSKGSISFYRYEDLMGDQGFETWYELWKELGVVHKTTPEYYKYLQSVKINRTQKAYFPPYTQWSTKDKDDFWAICGATMTEFNYA